MYDDDAVSLKWSKFPGVLKIKFCYVIQNSLSFLSFTTKCDLKRALNSINRHKSHTSNEEMEQSWSCCSSHRFLFSIRQVKDHLHE